MNQKRRSKYTVLIVDDVPKNVQVLCNLLAEEDCEIAVAFNGQQALKSLEEITPDLILLDVMMPAMSGFEVCQRIKEVERTTDIPIIFLTARTEMDDIVHGFELGAVDYVTKPFHDKELLARVRTHLALKRTREELTESNAAKDKFFSIISHDLRDAFVNILSFIQYIEYVGKEEVTHQTIAEFIDTLKSKTEIAFKLLENLLEWAKTQTNRIRFNPIDLKLTKVLEAIREQVSGKAQEKEIALEIEVDAEEYVINADKNMLDSILRNLATNAIKFTPNNGKVKIDVRRKNDDIQFTVRDNGIGIEKKNLPKLFRIDQHVTTPGTNNEQGTGLGLILCKEFVEQHGGKIWAQSELDEGSAFSFTLPLESEEKND